MMMTNRQYTALVEAGKFPEDPEVPIDAPFMNANGLIVNLLLEKFTSVALIGSQAGAIRANHYHKTDWHYAFVLKGGVDYHWRPVGSKEVPECRFFGQGQMFFTPPLVEHAMCFSEDTEFVTFAKNVRDAEHHEEDLVRVPLMVSKWKSKGIDGGFYFEMDPRAR